MCILCWRTRDTCVRGRDAGVRRHGLEIQRCEGGLIWSMAVYFTLLESVRCPGVVDAPTFITPGMMSYLLKDPSGLPWVVFTGDALFAGEVGRIDLLGMDKAPEMAGILYHSIFDRLLHLGDGV